MLRKYFSLTIAVILSTASSVAIAKAFNGNVILGSPTANSIKANVFSPDQSGSIYIEYGTTNAVYTRQTTPTELQASKPLELVLDDLQADTGYYYRLVFQATGESAYTAQEASSFHTARLPGSNFSFAIQGDSHPERAKKQFDSDLYIRTLQTVAAEQPDFYFAMGDDFSIDTLDPATINVAKVTERYRLQRSYLGLIGRTAPIFLVNGNHEQASMANLDGTANNVAVWAQNARNSLFSQPAPDENFYTGDAQPVAHIGLLRDYYAFTWGDALFVVIDPYWHSPQTVDNQFGADRDNKKGRDLWNITLGEIQYQWFKNTLETSTAKYKFVFSHHVLGTGRGGIEQADLYEWGGLNAKGTWEFDSRRPGWELPIHQLMVENHVTIFFQGHDHIWVRQELDGVIYQSLPEPADPFYTLYNDDAYLSGDKFSNTGYTRVAVSPSQLKVDYVRTYLPGDENAERINGKTAFSYSIAANGVTNSFNLAINKSGSGNVTSQPAGIDCGIDCNATFAGNSSVTLLATAAAGYVFDGWSGGCSNKTGNCMLTLTGDSQITAVFALDKLAPTVTRFEVPAVVNTLSIPVTALTASDNDQVAGYLITAVKTLPSSGSAAWSTTVPDSFTVKSTGEKKLYAWTKDKAGNVSSPVIATVMIDRTAPVISKFSIPTRVAGLTIPISSFSASDKTAITGYWLSENAVTPSADAKGWLPQKPTSFTVTTAGKKQLFAWVKDAAGNVSALKTAKCIVSDN